MRNRYRLRTRPAYPTNLEAELVRLLLDMIKKYQREVEWRLNEIGYIRTDSAFSDLFDSLRETWGRIVNTAKPLIERIINRVERFQLFQWQKQIGEYNSLVPINQQRGFLQFGDMTGIIQSSVEQAVLLIRDLGNRHTDQISILVMDALANGVHPRVLSKQLRQQFRVTKKRADLIAVDQIGKAYGALTRARQVQHGIEEYEWITMLDDRVRPSHRARHGKIFSWDSPPADGHPGQPIRCRCVAKPVFGDRFGLNAIELAEDQAEEQARLARLQQQLDRIARMNA